MVEIVSSKAQQAEPTAHQEVPPEQEVNSRVSELAPVDPGINRRFTKGHHMSARRNDSGVIDLSVNTYDKDDKSFSMVSSLPDRLVYREVNSEGTEVVRLEGAEAEEHAHALLKRWHTASERQPYLSAKEAWQAINEIMDGKNGEARWVEPGQLIIAVMPGKEDGSWKVEYRPWKADMFFLPAVTLTESSVSYIDESGKEHGAVKALLEVTEWLGQFSAKSSTTVKV